MSGGASPGFHVFAHEDGVARWSAAAAGVAQEILAQLRPEDLRHGGTWFPGVDRLANAADGSIRGVPLTGAWRDHVPETAFWHRAQLSVVFPGYPRRDESETKAAHRYRVRRAAAHVDGLLPEGPERRRFLREPHAFILGLPLNAVDAAPLTVWPGSHLTMGQALREAVGTAPPGTVDLTEAYHAARRVVFDRIEPVRVVARPGQAILLHRHLLHGVAPWEGIGQDGSGPLGQQPRMIAYFRPELPGGGPWLVAD